MTRTGALNAFDTALLHLRNYTIHQVETGRWSADDAGSVMTKLVADLTAARAGLEA